MKSSNVSSRNKSYCKYICCMWLYVCMTGFDCPRFTHTHPGKTAAQIPIVSKASWGHNQGVCPLLLTSYLHCLVIWCCQEWPAITGEVDTTDWGSVGLKHSRLPLPAVREVGGDEHWTALVLQLHTVSFSVLPSIVSKDQYHWQLFCSSLTFFTFRHFGKIILESITTWLQDVWGL